MMDAAANPFIFGAYVLLAVVFLLLLKLYLRAFKARNPAQQDPVQNFTEMAVLFQTLRRIVEEQKSLAREFNKHMDRKAALIREAVKTVMAAQQRIDAQLAQLKEAQQAQGVGEMPIASAAAEIECAEGPFTSLDAVADSDDEWVGLDIGESEDAAPVDETPVIEDAPEVKQQTREAFRALLDMSSGDVQEDSVPSQEVVDSAVSLRERVYRYHDAGMSVAQIAQELGIGKGEARLMLGLRQRQANS